VQGHASDDAPTFPNDEMTRNTSSRSPSYSAWSDFCKAAGIYELFYDDEDGLICPHPGCKMLKPEHLLQVQAAVVRLKAAATKPPGFEGFPDFNPETKTWETPDEGRYDYTLARALWLEFWMKWALENCETPAIENT